MSYAPPAITAAGLTVPSYQDIKALYLASHQSIYGPGEYLGVDSALYQVISVLALSVADAFAAVQLDFNNRAPNFAIGPALDSLVKLNGLARKVAGFSTCVVNLVGTAGTLITNGRVRDSVPQQGVLWDLPSPLLIPAGGSISVVAVCETIGALNALPGQLNIIATPTAGWLTVTNTLTAVLGQPVETDSQLRTRQALSTQLPSITMLAGTVAAIAAVPNVTRYNVLENPTNVLDTNGNPPHSVTAVVEGGTDSDVATAIYNNRGIGPLTNGTTSVQVIDSNTGAAFNVSFDRPTYVPVYVIANVHPLAGYSSAIGQAVSVALVNYLNNLQIGELVTLSALYAVAMSATPNLQLPLFSIKSLFLGVAPAPTGTTDLPMLFYQVAQGSAPAVQVNLV